MSSALSADFKARDLEIGICDGVGTPFRVLSEDEIDAYLTRVAEQE